MPLIIPSSSISGGYVVDNSCRFDDGSSDYLNRSLGSQSSLQIGTFSFWIKFSQITVNRQIYSNEVVDDNNRGYIQFTNTDELRIVDDYTAGTNILLATNAKYRDISAFYHFVIRIDTTQSTNTDRVRVYVNGVQETSFSSTTYPTQNANLKIFEGGQTNKNLLGSGYPAGSTYIDGYISEFVYCDGQSLDPTSFGEFDADSGIWKPIDVSGLTFGNNGFYLPFENSGALGQDDSGNANNFTVNNLTSIDQTTDTPTNNACTLNPLYRYTNNMTYSEGNLKVVGGGASWQGANSTFYINKGKWFFEVKFASATDVTNFYIGWTTAGDYNISEPYDNGIHYYNSDGGEIYADSIAQTTADYGTFANGDIMGMALDYDNSLLTVYKNGSALVTDYDFSSATTTAKGGNLVTPTVAHYGSGTLECNFSSPPYTITSGNSDAKGYGNFEYSVPSGYYALNTKNLAEFG